METEFSPPPEPQKRSRRLLRQTPEWQRKYDKEYRMMLRVNKMENGFAGKFAVARDNRRRDLVLEGMPRPDAYRESWDETVEDMLPKEHELAAMEWKWKNDRQERIDKAREERQRKSIGEGTPILAGDLVPFSSDDDTLDMDLVTDIVWCYKNLHIEEGSTTKPPSSGSIGLLEWARRNQNRFFESLVPKMMSALETRRGESADGEHAEKKEDIKSIAEMQDVLKIYTKEDES